MLYVITFPPGILAGGNRPFNRNLKHKSCSLYQPQAITVKEDAVESITSTSSKLSKKYIMSNAIVVGKFTNQPYRDKIV